MNCPFLVKAWEITLLTLYCFLLCGSPWRVDLRSLSTHLWTQTLGKCVWAPGGWRIWEYWLQGPWWLKYQWPTAPKRDLQVGMHVQDPGLKAVTVCCPDSFSLEVCVDASVWVCLQHCPFREGSGPSWDTRGFIILLLFEIWNSSPVLLCGFSPSQTFLVLLWVYCCLDS